MDERIDLVVLQEKKRAGGVGLAVAVSAVVHAVLLVMFIRSYRAVPVAENVPIARYVELIKQNPRQFVEAPGPKLDHAPNLNAPLSDANREASTPQPTGPMPTTRPGDGRGSYTPPSNPAPRGPAPAPGARSAAPSVAGSPTAAPSTSPTSPSPASTQTIDTDRLVFREKTANASAAQGVNWNNAIKEIGKVASLGGGQDLDLGQLRGGKKGFAKEGPLSFETTWFDWGEYAASMVRRLRVNWDANMPDLLHTGMPGVVTIRFTIHRDGRITDIEILESSGIPPYDFAARKAIEQSSPLNPLPKKFPMDSERVTCGFYYNTDLPE